MVTYDALPFHQTRGSEEPPVESRLTAHLQDLKLDPLTYFWYLEKMHPGSEVHSRLAACIAESKPERLLPFLQEEGALVSSPTTGQALSPSACQGLSREAKAALQQRLTVLHSRD